MPEKYYVSELFSDQLYNAAVGRKDIESLLDAWSYQKIDFAEDRKGVLSKTRIFLKLFFAIKKIRAGDVVFFHFPLFSSIKKLFLRLLRRKRAFVIGYVNDLEGLRDQNPEVLKTELVDLSQCSGAIVLNDKMKKFVAEHCPELKLSSLIIWDYLLPEIPAVERTKTHEVTFAGNQAKAPFISLLGNVDGVLFHLYGSKLLESYSHNCKSHGEVDSRLLPAVCKGSFGLVWDGPSIDTCEGGTGSYMRINSPYKISLYLMAGLPLLIWKEAALADWITENNFGIKIDSLHTINQTIDSLSEEEYQSMRERIRSVQPLIAQGHFLKTALEDLVGRNV